MVDLLVVDRQLARDPGGEFHPRMSNVQHILMLPLIILHHPQVQDPRNSSDGANRYDVGNRDNAVHRRRFRL
jgi:hypothetical protein